MCHKMIRRSLLAVFCCFLALLLMVTSLPMLAVALEGVDEEDATENSESPADASEADYKEQLENLQSQSADIEKRKKDLEGKLAEASKNKKGVKAELQHIDEQMSITQDEIALHEEEIAVTTNYINNKIADINAKESDIEYNMQLFRDRVRALYMTGGYSDKANSVAMLLSSTSISEFLTRDEFLKRISEHDTELVHELQDELAALEEEKAALEAEKAVLEAEKAELDAKKAELEEQKKKAQESYQDYSAMEAEAAEDLEETKKLLAAVQAEIADVYKSIKTSSEDYVGGEMMWPVPGYSTISCYYGWRFNHTDFHTGNDITGGGIHGAKVVAANTGTVVFTKLCPYNGKAYGYGTYVIIDHGGDITTLYAHLSNITVNVGDIVAMGQQIGNVGNTGWSTGAHLHFEVRKGGSAVDSLPYIT